MNTSALLELPADLLADLAAMGGAKSVQGAPSEDRLDKIGQIIAGLRDDAVKDRLASGLEDIMLAAEEAYVGIDAGNRGDFANARWAKPATADGPVSRQTQGQSGEVRSSVYVRLTARYVDAGAAKLAEILLPPDDKAFSIEPTPVPDLQEALNDERQVVKDGIPLERDARPDEIAAMSAAPTQAPASPSAAPAAPAPAAPGVQAGAPPMPGQPQPQPPQGPPQVPLRIKDLAEETMNKAKTQAKKAGTRIQDWLVEARYAAEARKIIFDAAKLGSGVLKGPFPKMSKDMRITKDENGAYQLAMLMKISPSAKRVSVWDLFPDKSCGEDIHNGDYIFERDRISARSLRELKELPGYLPDRIDRVLEEGPNKKYLNDGRPDTIINDERWEVWYYYGTLSREDMLTLNPKAKLKDQQKEVYAQVTLVNDSVIRAVLNPLDSGKFPYHVMPWQRREGSWIGIGIAEQVAAPQRMVVAATRAMLDNAGLSAGAQIIVDRTCVSPADKSWAITRNKIWYKTSEGNIDDVRKAFAAVEFPSRQEELMNIIEYAFRLAEESTNIPLITQGQSGETTPETFGATQLQNNNANQLLRAIGYAYDDYVTAPFIIMCYEWLLLDPKVPNDEKGDYKINAHGSAALVERAIAEQTIASMAEIVEKPAFGVNPRKWFANYLKSKRLDPRDYQWTEEEQKRIDSQPPPKAPQVEAAQIRAQTDLQRAKMDTDRDTVYVNAETQRTQAEMQMQIQELQLKKELEMLKRDLEILKLSNARGIAVDQIKAELARDTMKLRTQEKLAHEDRAAEVLHPPTEPPGRAPAGQSFER